MISREMKQQHFSLALGKVLSALAIGWWPSYRETHLELSLVKKQIEISSETQKMKSKR